MNDIFDSTLPASGAGTRWMGVGHSNAQDSSTAGAEAAKQALQGDNPRLLVVFCSDSYDLQALLDAINKESGDVPLIGCSTAGEIATNGPAQTSVVVTAIGGPGFSISTRAAMNVSSRLREAGAEVAASLEDVSDMPHRVLMLLTDGLAGDQQEIVRGAYGVVGAEVPLVGGCAGDDLKMKAVGQSGHRRRHRGRGHRFGGADRHRRPSWMEEGRRTDARYQEREQPRVRAR